MSPHRVGAILLGELVIVGGAGGIVGCGLAIPAAKVLQPMLVIENVTVSGMQPTLSVSDGVWCAVIVAATCFLSASAAIRSNLKAPEAGLLRGEETKPVSRAIVGALFRGLLVIGAAAGLIATLAVDSSQVDDIYTLVTGSGFAVLALVILLTPWVSPLIERMLGALPLHSVSWHVATRTCAADSGRSSATVLPFTIAIGLTGLFFGWKVLGASGVTPAGLFSMFGPALIVAWVGGVAVIAMSAARRQRDGALLIAAGAREEQLFTIDLSEGIVHTVAATLAGLTITVGSLLAGAKIFGAEFGPTLRDGPWLEVGIIAAATLITTCVAVTATRALAPSSATLSALRANE